MPPSDLPLGQPITTRTCTLTYDSIVRGVFLDGAEVAYEDAVENVAATARLTGGRRVPVLVDLRKCRSQSTEARAFLAGPEALAVTLALAMVMDNPLSRMLGNFFMGFNRPPIPIRLFTNVTEAEAWLRTFLPAAPHGG